MNQFPGMPPIGSAHGPAIDHMMWLVHILMAVVFIGWAIIFVYMLIRFRAKKQPKADPVGVRTHASRYAEIAVAIAEGILLVGFSIPLWSQRVDHIPEPDQALEVHVVAEQFAWNVHYAGPDGIFGKSAPEFVDASTNPLGLDPNDPAGKDDVTTINQLHVPVNEPVVIHLTSKDVIHSFYLPEMRIKQDAIPGMEIPLWFTPTKTTAEMRQELGDDSFQYEIGCAQLCGIGHYRMRGFLTVESKPDFDAWIQSKVPSPQQEEQNSFWQ